VRGRAPDVTAVPTDCRLRCEPHRPHLEVRDNQGADLTRLVRCERCTLVYEHPRPSREAIDAFYGDPGLWQSSTDAEGRARSYVSEIEAKMPAFHDLARRIDRRFPSGGRLLDVGSGPGLLELALDPARWDVTGVEMAPWIAEFGRDRLGANVRTGTFGDAGLEAGSFDVVVLKYVLDHMEEPWEELLRARDVLRAGGLLVVADLINIESFCARLFGRGFRLIHPMHFTYFSPRTARLHLERAGFRVERIEFPFLRTPYFTPRTLGSIVGRVARRLVTRRHVVSPPCYGNMMDVFAVAV
jgi:SAM-dependent methyltransferase